MIQANAFELKYGKLCRGNWILDDIQTPRQVDYIGETIGFRNEIGGTDKFQSNPIWSGDIDLLKPIPLTPEILEKCGFKWNGDKGKVLYYFFNGIRITMPTCSLSILRSCDKAGESQNGWCGTSLGDSLDIKYLHQLQNLFFALTGTELNYNPCP
jgi:hypothetical protein